MSVKIDHVSPTKVTLEIEVGADKVKEHVHRAITRASKQVQVPGFRKGKAPLKLAEKYLNRQYLYRDAIDHMVTEAYITALKQEKLDPVSHPSLELINELEEEKPFTFKATFERRPVIDLGEYKSIEIDVPRVDFKKEDVETTLRSLQEQRAVYKPVDGRSLALGDFAILDYEGTVDGTPFEGGTAAGRFIEIVESSAIPGFIDKIIGMSKGDERILQLSLPEEFSPEHTGKEAQFTVRLMEIKEKQLPELNDAFAKELGPFETLEKLREEVKKHIENSLMQQEQTLIAERAVRKTVDAVTIELPQSLINAKIDALMHNLHSHLSQRGGTIEQYCELRQITKEFLQQEMQEEASKQVKTDLVLEEIAKIEQFEISEEEIDLELERFVQSTQNTATKANLRKMLERQGKMTDLRLSLAKQKAVKLLASSAKVTYTQVEQPTGESKDKDYGTKD